MNPLYCFVAAAILYLGVAHGSVLITESTQAQLNYNACLRAAAADRLSPDCK
jgi:hypothetical protein